MTFYFVDNPYLRSKSPRLPEGHSFCQISKGKMRKVLSPSGKGTAVFRLEGQSFIHSAYILEILVIRRIQRMWNYDRAGLQ